MSEDFLKLVITPEGENLVAMTQDEIDSLVFVGERVIPASVTRFQALAALLQTNMLDDIKAYMASDSADEFGRLAFDEAQEFRRESPLVTSIANLFGLTDAQLDDLFVFAATITG